MGSNGTEKHNSKHRGNGTNRTQAGYTFRSEQLSCKRQCDRPADPHQRFRGKWTAMKKREPSLTREVAALGQRADAVALQRQRGQARECLQRGRGPRHMFTSFRAMPRCNWMRSALAPAIRATVQAQPVPKHSACRAPSPALRVAPSRAEHTRLAARAAAAGG